MAPHLAVTLDKTDTTLNQGFHQDSWGRRGGEHHGQRRRRIYTVSGEGCAGDGEKLRWSGLMRGLAGHRLHVCDGRGMSVELGRRSVRTGGGGGLRRSE